MGAYSFDYAGLISQSSELVKGLLQEFSGIGDFGGKLAFAFGNDFNREIASELQVQWLSRTFEFPSIDVLSQSQLKGANGAYAASENRIYLSEEFLSQNQGDVQAITSVLLEEFGHYVDSRINSVEAAGDEGAIFSALVQGFELKSQELAKLRIENDTNTIILNGNALVIEQALSSNDLDRLINGLDLFLSQLQDIVDEGDVLGRKLPLIGQQLDNSTDDAIQFLNNLRAPIKNALELLNQSNNFTNESIGETLTQVLQEQKVLPEGQNVKIISTAVDDIRFQVLISESADDNTLSSQLSNDIGLPGLKLSIDGNAQVGVGYEVDLNFGVDGNGFYFFTGESDPEITLDLKTSVPNLNAKGTLADFLEVNVQDNSDEPSRLSAAFDLNLNDSDGKLRLSEIENLDINDFEIALDGETDINFKLNTSFQDDRSLPKIDTDLNIDWDLTGSDLGNPNVVFNNISLDLGSFFNNFATPLLDEIDVVLDPIEELINFLTTPVDLKIVVLDLLEIIQLYIDNDPDVNIDLDFIRSIGKVLNLVNSIPNSSNLNINLGSLDLGGIELTNPQVDLGSLDINNLLNNSNSILNSSEQIFSQFEEGSSSDSEFVSNIGVGDDDLDFTILTDPTQIFKLLLGQDATLFRYDLPDLIFEVLYQDFTPIFGPLGVDIGGTLSSQLNVEIGFDTFGLRNPEEDFFEGFFIGEESKLTFFAELIGAIAASSGVVTVGGGPFLRGGLGFDLTEPVRFSEIEKFVEEPENIFSSSGLVEAGLAAYARFPLYTLRYDTPTIELIKWGSGVIPPGIVPDGDNPFSSSTLADLNGTTLELFVGNRAKFRQPTNIQDSQDEYIEVFQYLVRGDVKTSVNFASLDQSDDNITNPLLSGLSDIFDTEITAITGNAGTGNDIIDLQGPIGNPFAGNLIGGSGNDILIGSLGSDTLRGGEDSDRLIGNESNDSLLGEDGGDELFGGDGNDTLQGGANQLVDSPDQLYGEAGDDELLGGEGVDILIGGEGADIINGGADFDIASYQNASQGIILNLTTGEQTGDAFGDSFIEVEQYEGSSHNDSLVGNSASNIFYGGEGDDILEGGGGNDVLISRIGDDVIDGGEGLDRLVIDYSTLPTAAVAWFGQDPDSRLTQIYIANAYGIGEPIKLADGLFNQFSLDTFGPVPTIAISADGRTLSWISRDIPSLDDRLFIYKLDDVTNSGTLKKYSLPNNPTESSIARTKYSLSRKGISDDGGKVVFSANTGRGGGSDPGLIYTINTDGSDLKLIFENPNGSTSEAAISGDGSTVAWSQDNDGRPGDRSIAIADSDGTSLREIGESGRGNTRPSLSKDGSIITWTDGSRVFRSNSDGIGFQPLDKAVNNSFSAPNRKPIISQNGANVVFDNIAFLNLNTISPQSIFIGGEDAPIDNAYISPDGDQIVFTRDKNPEEPSSEIFISNLSNNPTEDSVETNTIFISPEEEGFGKINPVLSAYVDIGARYQSFDLATGSGEIASWGPSRIRFRNIESFDLIGTIYGDELYGGNNDDRLSGTGGPDTLAGGLGSDQYTLVSETINENDQLIALSGGSIIRDSGGDNDELTFSFAPSIDFAQNPEAPLPTDSLSISLKTLTPGEVGLGRYHTSLLIDLNQDGMSVPEDDLLIADFFTPLGTAGQGFIETVANLSGTDILNIFSSFVNNQPQASNDSASGGTGEFIPIDVLANDVDIDGDTLEIQSFDTVSSAGGSIQIDNNGTPDNLNDDKLLYLSPEGFSGRDSFSYQIADQFGGVATSDVNINVELPVRANGNGLGAGAFSFLDGLGFTWTFREAQADFETTSSASRRREANPYTYLRLNDFNSNSDFDTSNGSDRLVFTEANGREVILTDSSENNIILTRKIYISEDQAYVRFLETVTNSGTESISHTFEFESGYDFESSQNHIQTITSSGDDQFATLDNWIVIDEINALDTLEPPLIHVLASQNAMRPSNVILDNDQYQFTFDLILQPGESKTILHFAALDLNSTDAQIKAEQLSKLELDALAYLSPQELSQIVNFEIPTKENRPPIANFDTFVTAYNTPINVEANMGVLSNDNDLNGDALTVNLIQDVSHGVLELNDDGSFTYIPNTTFSGNDSFTYQANDGITNSDTVNVTLTVASVETIAPNNGDGNLDGIPDVDQDYVASFLQLSNTNRTEDIVTLSAPMGTTLSNIVVQENQAPDAPGNPEDLGVTFLIGQLSFELTGFTGTSVDLRLQLPEATDGISANTYWKYGPTPDNTSDHWYEFLYDGTTGAEFIDTDNDGDNDEVLLHFVDGQRGDSDLLENGIIVDPGAVGVKNETPMLDLSSVAFALEILSKQTIYEPLSDLETSGSLFLTEIGYEIDQVFNDPITDLQALGLRSSNPDLPPILVFRGTESNLDNEEGTNPNGIGSTQFAANKADIQAWLTDITQDNTKNPNGLKPVVTGQSLGGALTQFTAAEYPDLVSQAITFGSPSLPQTITDQFIANGGDPSQITHYVTSGDFVSLAGQGVFLPGQVLLYTYTTPESDPAEIPAKHDQLVLSDAPAGTTFEEISIDDFNADDFTFTDADYQEFLQAIQALDPDFGNGFTSRAAATQLNQNKTYFQVLDQIEQLFTAPAPIVSISSDVNQLIETEGTQITISFAVEGEIPAGGLPVFIASNLAKIIDDFEALLPNDLNNISELEGLNSNDGFVAVLQSKTASFTATVRDDAIEEGTESVTLSIIDDQTLDPDPNANAIDFTIIDTVAPTNTAPSAQDDAEVTDEDTTVTIDVAANDTDTDGNLDPSSVMQTSAPMNGTLENNGDGTIDYTPNPNFNGTDSFTYEISDTEGLTSTATVNITINPVNDAPVGESDSFSVEYSTPLEVTVNDGVLTNDKDPEGDALTANLIQTVSNGTLDFNEDGSFTYTPNNRFSGEDIFTYQANDGTANSDPVTVTLSVASVETLAPNDGDGNQDDIPDDEQAYVESRLQLNNNNSSDDILTLAGPQTVDLSSLEVRENPAPDAPGAPNQFGTDFPIGYLSFNAPGLTGDSVTLSLQLPEEDNQNGDSINTYWKYGATPDNPTDHWYQFIYDGTTGAEFLDNDGNGRTDEILLHFVDGLRGDGDLMDNGIIVDPGAPGIANTVPVIASTTFMVKETAAVNTEVGTVNVTDLEGDTFTLSITNGNTDRDGDANAPFSITNAGLISVNDADDLDADQQSQFDLEITVTDEHGLASSETITINILKDGSSTGDPHFTTFDGHYYHFQGVGEFTLAESLTSDLLVQTRQSPWKPNPRATVNTAVATKLDDYIIQLSVEPELSLTINDTLHELEVGELFRVGSGSVTRTQLNQFLITYESGEQLRTEVRGSAKRYHLNPHLSLIGGHPVRGLLGNNDGNTFNDQALWDGSILELKTHVAPDGEFADSWRVLPEESILTAPSTEGQVEYGIPDRDAITYVVSEASPDLVIEKHAHGYDKIDLSDLDIDLQQLDTNHDLLITASDSLVSKVGRSLSIDLSAAGAGELLIQNEFVIFHKDFQF